MIVVEQLQVQITPKQHARVYAEIALPRNRGFTGLYCIVNNDNMVRQVK